MSHIPLKLNDAQLLLRALESQLPAELKREANKLKAAIKQHKSATTRRRLWWTLSRVLPLLALWGLLSRVLLSLDLVTLTSAAALTAGGTAACLLLPGVALLFWLPLTALQYAAIAHLIVSCAFPQACSTCNWALKGTIGTVEMEQLQTVVRTVAAWLPFKFSMGVSWQAPFGQGGGGMGFTTDPPAPAALTDTVYIP